MKPNDVRKGGDNDEHVRIDGCGDRELSTHATGLPRSVSVSSELLVEVRRR